MSAVLSRVPRVVVIVSVVVLASATLTLAATSTVSAPVPAAAEPAAAPAALVVPDVRKQAYVFAKGTLEQAGFAWKVVGPVQGYAANVVVTQTPAPGAQVVPDGSPVVVLTLGRNSDYDEEGLPENVSPYPGKPPKLVGAKPLNAPAVAKPAAAKPAAAKPAAAKPAAAKPAAAKPAAKAPAARKPAFLVPGAPAEPLDELALDERARRLASWLERNPEPTDASVNHWLYQHNWIVTGAAYGWARGAEALRTLVEVDRRVQELWGIGARSERLARRTLANVEKRSR